MVIDDLSDFLVVDTDDVLVICRRNNETDFKRYINDAMLKYGEKYLNECQSPVNWELVNIKYLVFLILLLHYRHV